MLNTKRLPKTLAAELIAVGLGGTAYDKQDVPYVVMDHFTWNAQPENTYAVRCLSFVTTKFSKNGTGQCWTFSYYDDHAGKKPPAERFIANRRGMIEITRVDLSTELLAKCLSEDYSYYG